MPRPLCILMASAAALLAPAPAPAQDFPTKPIRLIVPFPAGGPADIIGRALAEKLAALVSQPVVIENRAGAAGVTGVAFVGKAEPDGHTIGIAASSTLSINVGAKPYDPLKDLALVTQLVRVHALLVVNEKLPARTLAELVALAKAQPGKLNYATPGAGTISHLIVELLKLNTGIDLAHVPYAGAAPAINDLLGGHVQMLFADLPVLLPHVEAGKLRALAVGSIERAPSLPAVPTARELGWHDVVADNWYGLVAPPLIPPPVLARLHAAVTTAMRSDEVRQKLALHGTFVVANTSEQFTTFVKAEIAKWAKVVDASGVKLR